MALLKPVVLYWALWALIVIPVMPSTTPTKNEQRRVNSRFLEDDFTPKEFSGSATFNEFVQFLSSSFLTLIQNGVDLNLKVKFTFGQWNVEALVSVKIVEIWEILVGKCLIIASVSDTHGVIYTLDKKQDNVFSEADLTDFSKTVARVMFTYILHRNDSFVVQ